MKHSHHIFQQINIQKRLNSILKVFAFLAFTSVISTSFAQTLPTRAEVVYKMKLVNDYWISQNTSPGNNQWARAVYFAGNVEFYKLYPKDAYLQYANLWATNNGWGLNGGTATRNADNQTCGQAYIDMYNLDSVKQPNKIAAIKTSIDNMVFSQTSTDWTWIDALFMAMPVFARVGVLTNDTTYYSRMYDLYAYNKYTLGLYNATEGLWYRDVNYKPPYTTKNGLDCYWARGNGWVIGAHARILQLLPANDRHRDEYIQTFQAMAAALKDRQRTDGFWNSSLDDPNEYNGPETSGTAFFTYGIAWGINNHLLDSATYYPVVQKAWNGLVTTAVQTSGLLGYVQGVGAAPAFASANTTQDFGVGAFLMAGTEVQKLTTGALPIPTNFSTKSLKLIDLNHISISFSKKINLTTALNPANYVINNGITVNSVAKGSNDSTAILTISSLSLGAYQLQVSNITSTDGSAVENGETRTFSYSGISAVTASGFEPGTSNTADKTLDYDFATRWSCDGKNQWILYDLGEVKLVKSVDIAFFNGNVRKGIFSMYLSTNLTDTVQVFNGMSSGRTTALENYDFTDQAARYVKIIGQGNTQSTWNSITETRINWDKISGINTLIAPAKKLNMYPNPLQGTELNIDINGNCELIISDMCGKTVVAKTINTTENSFRLSNLKLASGAYTVTTRNNNGLNSGLLLVK